MNLKNIFKAILQKIFSEYRINFVYDNSNFDTNLIALNAGDVFQIIDNDHLAAMESSSTSKVRGNATYGRAGMLGFAILHDGIPFCVAHFSTPEQYDRPGTWPLFPGELALMDIATEEAERGHGLAAQLISQATAALNSERPIRIIAFIWWNNTPSIRAFSKAGWRRIGMSTEFRLFRRWFAVRVPWYRTNWLDLTMSWLSQAGEVIGKRKWLGL